MAGAGLPHGKRTHAPLIPATAGVQEGISERPEFDQHSSLALGSRLRGNERLVEQCLLEVSATRGRCGMSLAQPASDPRFLLPREASNARITADVSRPILVERRWLRWWIALACTLPFVAATGAGLVALFVTGVGLWGINTTNVWGIAIANYVWWIGIGNAGTLISGLLLLTRQGWRASINRFAEAMTLFAVACAGMFPLLHMGRPWLFFWLTPYPNPMWMWPQFRSPLVWDVFAVSTYSTLSLLFWFVGLIPDLATLRDRAKNRAAKIVYGIFAMGWRGSAVHWSN